MFSDVKKQLRKLLNTLIVLEDHLKMAQVSPS
jgi:hypothetical protein